MEKTCSKCGETKDVLEFCCNKSKKDGCSTWCKNCTREYDHKRKWRQRDRFKASLGASRKGAKRRGHTFCTATLEEIEAAFTGKCAICGIPEIECQQKLHMDHDHETGNFRGWICWNCNNLLGRAKDSEEILLNALDYLLDRKESYCE